MAHESGSTTDGSGTNSSSPQEYPPRGTGKRKGHRKSRWGCLACKARKVKCQETRPACANCKRAKVECRYPNDAANSLVPASQIRSMPDVFTASDLRCFHHFLTLAHPHLPLGTSTAWVQDVPRLAHEHAYLMHSLLALGGAHLDFISASNQSETEKHRLLAIKGLNETIPMDQRSTADNDAMLAACYALTFVSSYRGDSLADFLRLVRGCGFLTMRIREEDIDSMMVLKDAPTHDQVMENRLNNLPAINPAHVAAATTSLAALRPFCTGKFEARFLDRLLATVSLLEPSSRDAYYSFVHTYEDLTTLSHEEFEAFVDPSNEIAQVIQGHFVAVEALMTPHLARETARAECTVPGRNSARCVQQAYDNCSPFGKMLLNWPYEFCFHMPGKTLKDILPLIVRQSQLEEVVD